MMKTMRSFRVSGTATGSKKSKQLDEITILANPDTLRRIAIFLIGAAHDMEVNQLDHVHLQDTIKGFSYDNHVDIIVHGEPKKR
ncbi:hypothetical protein INH39_15675 [Massilia violaceinigra]|uniref:Uncharacterized protein n=1 Tax=Massilia violaceinigra TaxID=2045208 RepID=A0ABY4ADW5_9BURK|nr:hypothetical protein [Massilia violaceinigra]UOD32956.1 hypothetical protein INH39_15675 [Massilia violaceinigra]